MYALLVSIQNKFVNMILLFIAALSLLLPSSSLISISAQNSDLTSVQCANYNSNLKIITITCDTNLSGIYRDINNKSVLEKDPNGVWILNTTIMVNPHAKITINNTDTSWLKIINKNAKEPNFISISGSAEIDHIKITSWDPRSNNTIRENVNGTIPRPYIMAINSAGNINISNSNFAFLGYNSYPSNGLVIARGGAGSNITNNTFQDMWDGFYSDHAGFTTIKNNIYYNNLRNGIDPHSGSHDFDISGNLAYNNSAVGINCSENCYNILVDNNIVHDNGGAGIMFSLQTNSSTIKKNFAYNEKIGISIFSSSSNKIYENLLKSSDKGVFISGNSSNNHVYNNSVTNTRIGIDFAGQPKNNLIENNFMQNVTYSIFAET